MPGGLDHFGELLVRSSVQIYDSREGWKLHNVEGLDLLLQGVTYRVKNEVRITGIANAISKLKDPPPTFVQTGMKKTGNEHFPGLELGETGVDPAGSIKDTL